MSDLLAQQFADARVVTNLQQIERLTARIAALEARIEQLETHVGLSLPARARHEDVR
jgi:cell division protein FtsB